MARKTPVGFVLFFFGAVPGVFAQEEMTISGEALCSACRVTTVVVSTLHPDSAGGTFIGMPKSAVEFGGSVIVTSNSSEFAPYVFDPRGVYQRRLSPLPPATFGGPTQALVGADGLLRVADPSRQTITIYNRQLEATSDHFIPAAVAAGIIVATPSGGYAANAIDGSPARVGLPLHYFDEKGGFIRSFGGRDSYHVQKSSLVYNLAVSSQGGLWSSTRNTYEISLWNAAGEREMTVTREAPWFPSYTEAPIPSPGRPPVPILSGIHEGQDGHLWTLVHVASENWADQEFRRIDAGDGTRMVVPTNLTQLYDTVVEELDPVTGEVLVTARIPEVLAVFLAENRFLAFRQIDDLAWSVSLVNLVVQR